MEMRIYISHLLVLAVDQRPHILNMPSYFCALSHPAPGPTPLDRSFVYLLFFFAAHIPFPSFLGHLQQYRIHPAVYASASTFMLWRASHSPLLLIACLSSLLTCIFKARCQLSFCSSHMVHLPDGFQINAYTPL